MEEDNAGAKLDKEHGVPQGSNVFEHDVSSLDIDLDSLTTGNIDWNSVLKSFEWMIDKTRQALNDHQDHPEHISQFLAKTCVLHVVQAFHHCRHDKPHGKAAQEFVPSPGSQNEPVSLLEEE